MKKILAAATVLVFAAAVPAMAQVERHQNPSLNGYAGFATESQYQQPTAFGTASHGHPAEQVEAVGSDNPSLESFNPNAVTPQSSRFGTAPNIAENPDFDWIDQADVGA